MTRPSPLARVRRVASASLLGLSLEKAAQEGRVDLHLQQGPAVWGTAS